MGPSLGFVTDVFFLVLTCVTYYGLLYCTIGFVLCHCWRFRIAPLELYCASVSQYYLSFKLSGKVVKVLATIRDLMRRVCVTVTEIQA